jgi:hypothetical protein
MEVTIPTFQSSKARSWRNETWPMIESKNKQFELAVHWEIVSEQKKNSG